MDGVFFCTTAQTPLHRYPRDVPYMHDKVERPPVHHMKRLSGHQSTTITAIAPLPKQRPHFHHHLHQAWPHHHTPPATITARTTTKYTPHHNTSLGLTTNNNMPPPTRTTTTLNITAHDDSPPLATPSQAQVQFKDKFKMQG